MNRPRNRQPRGPRRNHQENSGSRPSPQGSPATPQQAAGTVPTIQQVVPGASVFIVLKGDQPTGKETAGVVDELLTRGNHPRGIKVRLRNGQVGRVQRMGDESEPSPGVSENLPRQNTSSYLSHRYTDVRNDPDYPSEPPPRSLADFLPPSHTEISLDHDGSLNGAENYVAVQCPFCSSFTGDEVAVTHHIDREHLT
jgi:uncharacterized repeat protein (TIGR03833 family)